MINLSALFKKQNKERNALIHPVVLVVLDGFGIAPASDGNAITIAKTPNYDRYISTYPHTSLIASGESVGLPANEVGNTEVGHLTLGAGRVILQPLKRISVDIEKGGFYDNRAFLQAASHVKQYNSKLHIMGLVGSGHVHSSVDHLYALLQFCKKEEIERVYLHCFTDGRDSPPQEGIEIIDNLENYLKEHRLGKIASIAGRYYAMDRDRRWDRTEKAYNAIVSALAIQTMSAHDAVQSAYARGQTDEFIEPTVIADKNGPVATVDDNDAVIFYNFRIDRPKQLTMAFVLPDFENLKSFDFGYDPTSSVKIGEVKMGTTFVRQKIARNIFYVTMTEYHEELPVSGIAYGPREIEGSLSEAISEQGLRQMHMAESEKERFVQYYFDGLHENPFNGEESKIIPSPKVETYDKKPEMSLPKLVNEFIHQLNKDKYHFFVINFANPDMVAHSGNVKATIKAVEHVDKHLDRLVSAVLAVDGTVLITADHGNAEELLTFPTSTFFFTTAEGSVNTDHSSNPVPLLIINNKFQGNPVQFPKGALSDVASIVLPLLNIPVPSQMTGKNLIEGIQTRAQSTQTQPSNIRNTKQMNVQSVQSTNLQPGQIQQTGMQSNTHT